MLTVIVGAVLAWGQAPQARTQAIGVPTSVVAYRQLDDTVTAVATVAADETAQAVVEVRWPGWVEQVFVSTTGQRVKRGQPLFTLYSPALDAAEQEYQFAVANRDRLAASAVPGVAAGAASLLADAAARLRQQQVPAEEIARLQRTGQPQARLTVEAPRDGIITQRSVLPQMQVSPGEALYTLTGLAPIWVDAELCSTVP